MKSIDPEQSPAIGAPPLPEPMSSNGVPICTAHSWNCSGWSGAQMKWTEYCMPVTIDYPGNKNILFEAVNMSCCKGFGPSRIYKAAQPGPMPYKPKHDIGSTLIFLFFCSKDLRIIGKIHGRLCGGLEQSVGTNVQTGSWRWQISWHLRDFSRKQSFHMFERDFLHGTINSPSKVWYWKWCGS